MSEDYITPTSFYDLYYDFTGHAHPDYPKGRVSVAQDLSAAMSNETVDNSDGHLIIASDTGVYVYSSEPGHKCLASTSFRAAPNSGFYELTSVSHVGPAISYLVTLNSMNNNSWEKHLDPMIEHLRQVKEDNNKPIDKHWTTKVDCPAWVGQNERIKNLIDYACSLAGNFLCDVRRDKKSFTADKVQKEFIEVASEKFPISYGHVMIGTFSLIAFQSAYSIYQALTNHDINWKTAKIILHNLAGTNYSSGLTKDTNWVYPTIKAVAGDALPEERMMITPYATLPEEVGNDHLSDKSWELLANNVWGAMYARPQFAKRAFEQIKDIDDSNQKVQIPGDYGYTTADQIDHFLMRLKYSTTDLRQMLSNTVGFWMGGEAISKGWDPSKIDFPGFTRGFPDGISEYPNNAPEIS